MTGTAQRRAGESFAGWFERRLRALGAGTHDRIETTPPGFRPASVLAPFWRVGDRVEVALTLRTQTLSSHRGQISFPGGRRDPDDPDLAWTALRETHEELGIPPDAVDLIGRGDDAWSIQRYVVATHMGWLEGRPDFVPSPAEIERVIVADVETLMDGGVHRVQRMRREGVSFAVHYFEVGDDTVWGLTGNILYGLFQKVRGAPIADESRGSVTLTRFLGAT